MNTFDGLIVVFEDWGEHLRRADFEQVAELACENQHEDAENCCAAQHDCDPRDLL